MFCIHGVAAVGELRLTIRLAAKENKIEAVRVTLRKPFNKHILAVKIHKTALFNNR
jgi:hypothetical protein